MSSSDNVTSRGGSGAAGLHSQEGGTDNPSNQANTGSVSNPVPHQGGTQGGNQLGNIIKF